jgi:hypothetical protein
LSSYWCVVLQYFCHFFVVSLCTAGHVYGVYSLHFYLIYNPKKYMK